MRTLFFLVFLLHLRNYCDLSLYLRLSVDLFLDLLNFLIKLVSLKLASFRQGKGSLSARIITSYGAIYIDQFIEISYFSKVCFVFFPEYFFQYVSSIRKLSSSVAPSFFSELTSSKALMILLMLLNEFWR